MPHMYKYSEAKSCPMHCFVHDEIGPDIGFGIAQAQVPSVEQLRSGSSSANDDDAEAGMGGEEDTDTDSEKCAQLTFVKYRSVYMLVLC